MLGKLQSSNILLNDGLISEAIDAAKDALEHDDHDIAAWSLLSLCHLRNKALIPSRKSFERICQSIDRHDLFSLIYLGHINAELSRSEREHVQFLSYSRISRYCRGRQSFILKRSPSTAGTFLLHTASQA